jgi:DMSO/TMAO reductase YedYZ molybdopterin-dependent catalytic subunit
MKRNICIVFLIILMGLMSSCQAAPVEVAQTESVPAESEAASVVLEIVGPTSTKTFTMEELQQLTSMTSFAGMKSSTGAITPPNEFTGVPILDLVQQVGGLTEDLGVAVEAKDGYSITFSYDQIVNGNFIFYDVGSGDEIPLHGPNTVMIVYEMNGEPVDPNGEGPLRLVIAGDEKPITDGHWSVKWVTRLIVKTVTENWELHLEGAINELMDRATFESGASPDCHLITWTDDDGNEWSGIPLYYLVGRVDDEIKHNGPAYNDELGKTNAYTVDIVAEDGYTVTLDAFRVMRNDNIIVAHLVNGDPLDEGDFPLRLVGSDLAGNEQIGMIQKIILNFNESAVTDDPAATQETAVVELPVIDVTLAITGKVTSPLTLTGADLAAIQRTTLSTQPPGEDEPVDFVGIPLNTLLDTAGLQTDATKVIFTASDGYSAEVTLAELRDCPDCLIAFDEGEGYLMDVLPGFAGNTWVKYLIQIDIQ